MTFKNKADRRDPAVIWWKFLEQIEPQMNFQITHFYLQKYSQEVTKNIDDFLARCRLQVQKCKFRDNQETKERIIDQIIMETKYPDLQKQLLSKNEMSLQEVLNICRNHEASINYMRQMDELWGKSNNEISVRKHRPGNIVICCKCGYCALEIACQDS